MARLLKMCKIGYSTKREIKIIGIIIYQKRNKNNTQKRNKNNRYNNKYNIFK